MKIETVRVGAFEVNCYVVWGPQNAALVIDPGADAPRILGAIATHGLTVAAYLLTHGHMDHVGALAELYDKHPAPIGIHPDDSRWAFSEANQMLPYYPVPRQPAGRERALAHGQKWTDGGLEYEVLATPGHTPGGVSFFFPGELILFSGDTLFEGSVGRTDFPGGDPRLLSDSLSRLAELPAEVRVFPGHGGPTTIGQEKRTNYFLRAR